MLAATPTVAQDNAARAVGAGVGLLIGLAIMILVGAVVGWLAGLIVKGSGYGFWGDVLIGIGGSILAGFIFPLVGFEVGTSILASIIPAVIGAAILLLIIRTIRRKSG
ncbi:GlsB/YeaQ/YmgE family stress response membrane protein [Sulfitobacter sp. SK011]|nr:GlsB/YeaQ/YmgE family stress response membrane protein [Sulfitobacter sp. SK011]